MPQINKKKSSKKATIKKKSSPLRSKTKSAIEVAIVIPTYNEKENISILIKTLTNLYKNAHVFVVDDNSPDGTAKAVEGLSKRNKKIHLILRKQKQGMGRAYIQGFKEVLDFNPKFIVQMDADFSHNPEKIKTMLKLAERYDVVLGSRYIDGISVINWPLSRILLSWFANWFVRKLTRLNIMDVTGGFKCFRKEALSSLFLDKIESDGYFFQIEINYFISKLGYSVKEFPIIFVDRRVGQSKMNWNIVSEAFMKTFLLPLKRPSHYGHRKPGA